MSARQNDYITAIAKVPVVLELYTVTPKSEPLAIR